MNPVMRISLVLAREDNPRLYDELFQFPKGQRRVNRLRTLAYDGLLAQPPTDARHSARPEAATQVAKAAESCSERSQASLELFSEPIR